MKILFIILLTINLHAQKQYDYYSTFGFLASGTLLSNFKDAQSSFKDWLEVIAEDDNGSVSILFYSNPTSLYKDYQKDKLNMIVLPLPHFFRYENEIYKKSANYWTLSNDNETYTQYYLIANKSLNAKSFKNIKNKIISIKTEDPSLEVWIDKNSLLENKRPFKKVVKRIKYETKDSAALLDVFFKKTDFAVISKSTWDVMLELNPSINKRVEIIKKSKQIHLPFLGLFSKRASEKGLKSFFNLSQNIRNLKGGEQMIDLLKYDSVSRVDDKSLEILSEYYKEYFELKNRFK